MAVQRGQQVRRDALHHKIGFERQLGLQGPGAAVSSHGHARHHFHAAADGQVGLARHDPRCGNGHRLQARAAVAVDLHAGHRLVIVGLQHRHAGEIAPLLAHGHDAAQHHIVHATGVQGIALAQRH